ncbi:MAG TPA: 16S rRNA (adenine(1518)-N(6)/adenine(1519)-N(6))-dimethyltransferase RsmA [Spongiibacteraceae bacterium]|jgi:16S rRNA (adenine1518-N6/adenine1519-N6)-dimethyltransferase
MEHRARKRFGQNFLRDQNIIQRIVRAIHPRATETLLEIGPGLGALTSELLETDCELLALELDRDLVAMLTQKFGDNTRFHLQQGDALKLDLSSLAIDTKLRIVGNLPYNISTPLIFHLLRQSRHIVDMHFMLQKEVVQRLAAAPGNKEYGRLGIMTQYFCRIEPLLDVPPSAFSPQPKVQSAVVRLTPYAALPHPAKSVETLQQIVRTAFNQRRKTLRNALQTLLSAEQITACGIDPGVRPETLSLTDYVALADRLNEEDSLSEKT